MPSPNGSAIVGPPTPAPVPLASPVPGPVPMPSAIAAGSAWLRLPSPVVAALDDDSSVRLLLLSTSAGTERDTLGSVFGFAAGDAPPGFGGPVFTGREGCAKMVMGGIPLSTT